MPSATPTRSSDKRAKKTATPKVKKLKGKEKEKEREKPETVDVEEKAAPKSKEREMKKVKESVEEKRKEEETEMKPVSEKEKGKFSKVKTGVKTKSRKAPTPSPEPFDVEDSGADANDNFTGFADSALEEEEQEEDSKNDAKDGGEDEGFLHGFSSESDSSDEDDDDDVDKASVDVGKLPTIAKDDETVKRRLEKAKRQATGDRGVLYLGRIPHGFYEDQMKAYFSQFGDVTRLRLSRNKKTGKSKHYGFIEFSSSAVAQIVAETMDNYLLMGHILRCKLMPKEDVHPELWMGANKKFRTVPKDRIERVHQNKERTEEQRNNVEKRLLRRQEQKKRKLQALGIDYDLKPVAYASAKKVKQGA